MCGGRVDEVAPFVVEAPLARVELSDKVREREDLEVV